MKKQKNILIILIIIIILLLLAIVFSGKIKKNPFSERKTDKISADNFFLKTSFAEREELIKKDLAKKLSIDPNSLEVMIARESEGHITGVFFVEGLQAQGIIEGFFYGLIKNKIEIVWWGENQVDCSIIIKNKFPKEMAPSCF